ncbi:unnamed protein product, partial [Rotaria sp. Silwood1]
ARFKQYPTSEFTLRQECSCETSFDVHIQSVSQPLGNLQIGNIHATLAHIILEIPLDEIDIIGITRSTCDLQWLSLHNDDETSNQSYIIERQTEKR